MAIGTGLLAAVLGIAAPGHAAGHTVQARNFEYAAPSGGSTLTIIAGDQVTWVASGDPHTVTSGTPGAGDDRFPDHPAAAGFLVAGDSYTATFARPGTYPYFCEVHPEEMTGVVVVIVSTPGPTPSPPTAPSPAPTPRSTPAPTAASSGAAPVVSAPPSPATSPEASSASTEPTPAPNSTRSPAPAASVAPSSRPDAPIVVSDSSAPAPVVVITLVAVAGAFLVAGFIRATRRPGSGAP